MAYNSSLPSRERGLKCGDGADALRRLDVAPFAGAWIEICPVSRSNVPCLVAPFAGAWIEMRCVASESEL